MIRGMLALCAAAQGLNPARDGYIACFSGQAWSTPLTVVPFDLAASRYGTAWLVKLTSLWKGAIAQWVKQ